MTSINLQHDVSSQIQFQTHAYPSQHHCISCYCILMHYPSTFIFLLPLLFTVLYECTLACIWQMHLSNTTYMHSFKVYMYQIMHYLGINPMILANATFACIFCLNSRHANRKENGYSEKKEGNRNSAKESVASRIKNEYQITYTSHNATAPVEALKVT